MKIVLIILNFVFFVSSVNATTVGNYAEMSTAVAAMASDIAAHSYELKHGKSSVTTRLHALADVLSLAREGLFYYNNGSSSFNKDSGVNAAFVVHDLSRLYRHVTADDAFEQKLEEQALEVIDYCKAFILPILKGVTALGIACTQDNATLFGTPGYAGKNLRYIMLSTHSFTRLLEEYACLKEDSEYRYPLIVALCANVAWIVHEYKKYDEEWQRVEAERRRIVAEEERKRVEAARQEAERQRTENELRQEFAQREAAREGVVRDQVLPGECAICTDDESPLRVLHCGHAYCAVCLNREIDRTPEAGRQMDQVRCPQDGCRECLLRGDLAHITSADQGRAQRILAAYDEARRRPLEIALENLVQQRIQNNQSEAEIQRLLNAQQAIRCSSCQYPYIGKDTACYHITCRNDVSDGHGGRRDCGHQFCYHCGSDYILDRYGHYQAPAACGLNSYHPTCRPLPGHTRPV